jgi:hypothetical protein
VSLVSGQGAVLVFGAAMIAGAGLFAALGARRG